MLARKECTDAAAAFDAFAQTHGNIGGLTGTLPPGVRVNAGTLNLHTAHAGAYPEVVGFHNDLDVKVQLSKLQEAYNAADAAVHRLQRDLETALEFQRAMDDFILIMASELLERASCSKSDPPMSVVLESFLTTDELGKLRAAAAPTTVFGKLLQRTVQSCKSGSRAIEVDPAILHFAISLFTRSTSAYYTTRSEITSLPCVGTIHRILGSSIVRPGVNTLGLEAFIQLLKTAPASASHVALAFDEMSVLAHVAYCERTGQFVGMSGVSPLESVRVFNDDAKYSDSVNRVGYWAAQFAAVSLTGKFEVTICTEFFPYKSDTAAADLKLVLDDLIVTCHAYGLQVHGE